MAKNKGTFQFAANFEVKVSEALDPRLVAASKADLINKNNWPSDGDTIYVYKGLIVDCGNDGVYRLVNPANALSPDYSGWQRIDAGAIQIDNIFTYKGNIQSYDLLSSDYANIGDVYNVIENFTITERTPLGDETIKSYPGGTNVAWNGISWDPLAGAIDLSAYASKLEVSEIRTNVESNSELLNILNQQLESTNLELSKKVDMIEGSSLITYEQLELISSNSELISSVQSSVTLLESRVNDLSNNNSDLKINELLSVVETHTIQLEQIDTNITSLQNELNTQSEELLLVKNIVNSPGMGLIITDNMLQVKIDSSSNNRLTISNEGLLVDLTEDIANISNIIDDKINKSLSWDNI